MTTESSDGCNRAAGRADPTLAAVAEAVAVGAGWRELGLASLDDAEGLIEALEAAGCRLHELLYHRGDRCYVVRWR